ncbi:hypothetical protein DRN87_03590 [Candidatus Geothermarchaeota archaeon]|nr:MAG: hypothetical protein DRN87_03590 [Candidatus Geothermarchaeota archaeon]HEW94188.1 recombinase family protein [Thermoprotei archaeon]
MKAVIYSRVSTDEQNPRSQLQVVREYALSKNYTIMEVFEENISGSVHPLDRPIFKSMLNYVKDVGAEVIVMYDITRFYRPPAGKVVDALSILRNIIDEYNVLIDFAREPEIEDPLLAELWRFLKSWISAYERLQISMRTKYGLMRVKKEGRLYHKPDLIYYYAAWLYNKDLRDVTKEEYYNARRQLYNIIKKYWDDPRYKKSRIIEILSNNELKGMYMRFPKAPRKYITIYRLMKEV